MVFRVFLQDFTLNSGVMAGIFVISIKEYGSEHGHGWCSNVQTTQTGIFLMLVSFSSHVDSISCCIHVTLHKLLFMWHGKKF